MIKRNLSSGMLQSVVVCLDVHVVKTNVNNIPVTLYSCEQHTNQNCQHGLEWSRL